MSSVYRNALHTQITIMIRANRLTALTLAALLALAIVAAASCTLVSAQTSSSSSTGVYVDSSVLTVTLSLNRNPNLPLPSNFSTVLLADLVSGLNVTADRIEFGTLGGATSGSGTASIGTSITFSVIPSADSTALTPPQVLEWIQEQYQRGYGPLLQGEITSALRTTYLVVISTGGGGYASSSTASGNNTATAACSVGIAPIALTIGLVWLTV